MAGLKEETIIQVSREPALLHTENVTLQMRNPLEDHNTVYLGSRVVQVFPVVGVRPLCT